LRDQIQQGLEAIAPDSVLAYCWPEFASVVVQTLRRLGERFHLNRQDIEDIVNTALAQAVVKMPELCLNEEKRGLRKWFLTVIRGKAVDLVRWKLAHPTQSLSDAPARG